MLLSRNAAPAQPTGLGVLIDGLRRVLFSRRGAAGNGALQHVASLQLSAQSSVALVRLHDETLLLGITPQSVTLLTKSRDGDASPSAESAAR